MFWVSWIISCHIAVRDKIIKTFELWFAGFMPESVNANEPQVLIKLPRQKGIMENLATGTREDVRDGSYLYTLEANAQPYYFKPDHDFDGIRDDLDDDIDGDGLTNAIELTMATNPYLLDTDGDGLSDYAEVNYDADPSSYNPDTDTNPLMTDTDGDGLDDAIDPIPLEFNYNDGDLAPLGAPDGIINVGDLLVAFQIVLGLVQPTNLELAHGDLYPVGSPDGEINMSDLQLLTSLALGQ